MRRVAFLHPYLENDPEVLARVTAFREGLEALGWSKNRNIRVEHRYSGGDLGRMRAYAMEFVHSAPDVICGSGTPITATLKKATSTIPIIFSLVNDPVGQGFVALLSRPGGNITGFTVFDYGMGTKWVELLKEIAPFVTHVGVIRDPTLTASIGQLAAIQSAARTFGLEVSPLGGRDARDIERTVTEFAARSNRGLIASAIPFTANNRDLIISLAARHRLPAVYGFRFFVADGGLISYGEDSLDQNRQAAGYVDRILKGEKPANLPVQSATKYELVINLKTAKALGLTVPPLLLSHAIIE